MAKDSYKQYARSLQTLVENSRGKELSALLNAFAELLAKHQKLKLAPRIIEEYERLAKRSAGIVTLNITSAHKLNSTNLNAIKKAFGEDVEETVTVDEKLLGGFKVKTEDTIFDASLQTQLYKLKQVLS